jgi:hypothetical protein
MNTIVLLVSVVVPLFGALCFAAAAQAPEGGPPGRAAEHALLAKQAGTWDADIEMMGQKCKGVETDVMRCGGLWLISDFQGQAMGAPFEGHGTMGWDAAKKKYVGTWADSMGGPMVIMEGTASADGKVLTCFSEGPHPTGKIVRSKHVTTLVDARTRTYVITSPGPDGKEAPMLKITYTKKG